MLIFLVLFWIIYFSLHSLFASLTLKSWFYQRFPQSQHYYRLVYNLLSGLLLLPLLVLTLRLSDGQVLLLNWQGGWYWLAKGLSVGAIVLFIISTRFYDMSYFLGLAQLQANTPTETAFKLSPFHRFVRHPWYSLGLVVIWTHNMDIYLFSSALVCTLYIMIGVYFEEKKLCHEYGTLYQRYTQAVPALVPRPWRYLTNEQATHLLNSRQNNDKKNRKSKI